MKILPAIKGLITSLIMIGIILLIYYVGDKADSRIQYLIYIVYALGVFWTIMDHRRTSAFSGKFGESFNQGFRCFIVVTLVLALFYGVFNYFHPEFAEQSAQRYKEYLVEEKQTLPADIETAIATHKKQYTLKLVSGAIFGYLIIGAGVTAVISALIMKRK